MADHAEDDNDGDIFVYRGGRAPQHVTHVIIDKSVDEIEERAFLLCKRLVKVETHDGIRKVGRYAFCRCKTLPQIDLKSVSEISSEAFQVCTNLADVQFGDELETIGEHAFSFCDSLEHLKLSSIVIIESDSFAFCPLLTDIEFSERLETIGKGAFRGCKRLRRIAIPLKRDLFAFSDDVLQKYTQFDCCHQLAAVDLVGGIHTTVASLHMESWRNDMIAEINRINQILPGTLSFEKTGVIAQWMETVIDKFSHYKTEHCRYVKEGVTLLELALWRAKLNENEDNCERTKKAKIDAESARKERRITCGADMVIKNVLPFLQFE